ncbi:hypothetical protein T492DRAFT_890577 [Pavlovales sp. CCMP2436]|nr:hypothetical protein T492DRAFT_890577 [Pavlovales sp. CCMP2436]
MLRVDLSSSGLGGGLSFGSMGGDGLGCWSALVDNGPDGLGCWSTLGGSGLSCCTALGGGGLGCSSALGSGGLGGELGGGLGGGLWRRVLGDGSGSAVPNDGSLGGALYGVSTGARSGSAPGGWAAVAPWALALVSLEGGVCHLLLGSELDSTASRDGPVAAALSWLLQLLVLLTGRQLALVLLTGRQLALVLLSGRLMALFSGLLLLLLSGRLLLLSLLLLSGRQLLALLSVRRLLLSGRLLILKGWQLALVLLSGRRLLLLSLLTLGLLSLLLLSLLLLSGWQLTLLLLSGQLLALQLLSRSSSRRCRPQPAAELAAVPISAFIKGGGVRTGARLAATALSSFTISAAAAAAAANATTAVAAAASVAPAAAASVAATEAALAADCALAAILAFVRLIAAFLGRIAPSIASDKGAGPTTIQPSESPAPEGALPAAELSALPLALGALPTALGALAAALGAPAAVLGALAVAFGTWPTGAARNSHLALLQLARANGCEWDEEVTCRAAVRGGHLALLQWACANGCDLGSLTCASTRELMQMEPLELMDDPDFVEENPLVEGLEPLGWMEDVVEIEETVAQRLSKSFQRAPALQPAPGTRERFDPFGSLSNSFGSLFNQSFHRAPALRPAPCTEREAAMHPPADALIASPRGLSLLLEMVRAQALRAPLSLLALVAGALEPDDEMPAALTCRKLRAAVTLAQQQDGQAGSTTLVSSVLTSLRKLAWAVSCRLPMRAELCDGFAREGRLVEISWLHAQGCPLDESTARELMQMEPIELMDDPDFVDTDETEETARQRLSKVEAIVGWLRASGCPED